MKSADGEFHTMVGMVVRDIELSGFFSATAHLAGTGQPVLCVDHEQ
jgi:hypothetical protein